MKMMMAEPKLSVIQTNKGNTHTVFEISGLGRGMASGYAASLRTMLYEYVPGYGVVGFKLLGAKNSMEVLPQYTEPLSMIAKSIEQALVRCDDVSRKTINLTYTGEVDGDLTLGQFSGEGVEILNPELRILTTVQKQQVSMEIVLSFGVGYLREDANILAADREGWGRDIIRVNTDFCPVKFVNFKVIENLPTEGKDTLRLTIKTNGTTDTKTALSMASSVLIGCLNPLSKVYTMSWEELPTNSYEEEERTSLDFPIEELSLNPHTYNVLKRDGAVALRDLKGIDSRYKPEVVSQIVKALEEIGFTDIQLVSRK